MTKPSNAPATGAPAPLAGIRVLDMCRVLAGPMAAQMLGDLGAEVIKLERPGSGDESRAIGTKALQARDGSATEERAFFISCNRNKRSVTVDIAQAAGQEIVRGLAEKADVLIENYKVGTLERYGLGYEALRERNPRLIYCSITGYGQTGPRAPEPGYDPVFQAQCGLMSVTGFADDDPVKVGTHVVDLVGGYHAVMGILAALRHRDAHSGEGQHIDIGLFDCAAAMMCTVAQQYLISGDVPLRQGNANQSGGPSDVFSCSDAPVYLIAGRDHQFHALCEILDLAQLTADERFVTPALRSANRKVLHSLIEERVRRRNSQDLLAALAKAGIPCTRVNTVAQAFGDSQALHRKFARPLPHPLSDELRVIANPIRLSRSPVRYDAPPPLLGEHTVSTLREELGLDDLTIDTLKRSGAI